MQGKIVKAIAGFYYVHDGAQVHACRARGLFRNQDIKPLVGDIAEFELTYTEDVEGYVTDLAPRRNTLIRPAVANVDLMLAFFAMKDPAPNILHMSRLLLSAETAGVEPVIVLNKSDLVSARKAAALQNAFIGTGYTLRTVSVKTGEGIDALRPLLAGKTTVLAGPSGAGKSSFLNEILGGAHMETGEVSRKLQRGRHTTRHTELIALKEASDESFAKSGSYVLDTPGFTSLFVSGIASSGLQDFFEEFTKYIPDCRYTGCSHVNEKTEICGVRQAVERGEISGERYENYCQIYQELKERESTYR